MRTLFLLLVLASVAYGDPRYLDLVRKKEVPPSLLDATTIAYKEACQEAIATGKGLVVLVDSSQPPGIYQREPSLVAVRLGYFEGAIEGDLVFSGNRGTWFERLETVKKNELKRTPLPRYGQNVSR